MFKVGKQTVLRVIQEVGEAAQAWHDEHFRGLTIQRLALDEQWSYVHTHNERMTKAQKQENPGRGDSWLWAALDPESKAIVSWMIGKRTVNDARSFADDLATRVDGRGQITSDKLVGDRSAIPVGFWNRVDFAQEEKQFLADRIPAHEWPNYRTNPLVGVKREAVVGNPDLKTATVCHIERFFLTLRGRATGAQHAKRWRIPKLGTCTRLQPACTFSSTICAASTRRPSSRQRSCSPLPITVGL
jgi:hypothetical protein